MSKEITLPIEWDGWNVQDEAVFSFYTVNFLEDFGIISEGSYDSCLVDYNKGIIDVYNEEGDPILTQKFKCIPVNE